MDERVPSGTGTRGVGTQPASPGPVAGSSAAAKGSFISRALHAPLIIATLLGAGLTVRAASLPVVGLDEYFIAFYFWPLVGLLWLLALVASVSARDVRPAFIAPLVVVLTAVVVVAGLPRVLRVAYNEQALTAFVGRLEPADVKTTDWFSFEPEFVVGDIPVYWVEERGGIAHLVTGFVSSDTPAGLVYLPDGRLPPTDLEYEHLYGAWYRWLPW